MNEYFIRTIQFPNSAVKAFTICDWNGDYNIYLNRNLSDEAMKESCKHEIEHIKKGDFERKGNIQEIEFERHHLH